MSVLGLNAEKSQLNISIGEHGPGPPSTGHGMSAPYGNNMDQQPERGSKDRVTTDDKLSKELVRKEEELQRLRGEVQTYMMKIRGYQTLEHLLQESKQETSRYKLKHDELARQLDCLMRQIPQQNTSNTNPNTTTTGATAANTNSKQSMTVLEMQNASASGGGNDDGAEGGLRSDSWNFVGDRPAQNAGAAAATSPAEMKGVGDAGIPAGGASRPGRDEGSRGSSTASSPSFVRIDESPTSLVSGNFGGRTNSPRHTPSGDLSHGRHQTVFNHVDDASMSASMEVQQLTELFQKNLSGSATGGGGPASPSTSGAGLMLDLSSSLIKTGISVRNLEKQNRVQKVMIDQMSSKIDELVKDSTKKDELILELQSRIEQQQATINQLESSRDAAITEVRTKYLEVGAGGRTSPDPQSAISGEWVELEKKSGASSVDDVAAGMVRNAEEVEVRVTATSMVEVELRKRIEKLNATICELVTANRSWDDHCKKLELDHSQQVSALNNDLVTLRRRLDEIDDLQCRYDELRAADDRKQVEFDQMLLSAKKQREIEEMAKEEALNQLHQEKRFRVEADTRCVELERKVAQLESRSRELQLTKQVGVLGASGHESARLLSAGDRDLELQILREQVTVFKEDFDQERRDREAAQQTCERLQAQLSSTTAQLDDATNKLFRTVEELKLAQNQSEQFRSRFDRLADEIKVLQRQARPQQQHQQSRPIIISAPHVTTGNNYVTAPTPVSTQRHGLPSSSAYVNRQPSAVTFQPTIYQPTQATVNPYACWPCPKCTFANSGSSRICEICGLVRDHPSQSVAGSGGLTTYDVVVRSSRPAVAGLPDYNNTRTGLPVYGNRAPLQNNFEPWMHLPNSGLETDQPTPQPPPSL